MQQSSVTLAEILDARERRAGRQRAMLDRHGLPLVCLNMNIAGDVKRTPLVRLLFDEGLTRIRRSGFPIREEAVLDAPTGCEAILAMEGAPAALKAAAVAIEDGFPAARLLDVDVLDQAGTKLSRSASRACLVCGGPVGLCARSRAHGLPAVQAATEALLREFAAGRLAQYAERALLDEVYATPKPGLVDRNNTGAHRDMDIPLFERSAGALIPYFRQAVTLGLAGAGMDDLRRAGLAGEAAMFAATGGVNVHKGAVYSMGLLLYGMGRTLAAGGDAPAHAAALAQQDIANRPAAAVSSESAPTHGEQVRLRYGVTGIREEAAGGFPHARLAMTRLAEYRSAGVENPEALTLCDLMGTVTDSNLLYRGGPRGLAYVQREARRIAALPEASRIPALEALDAALIRRNLSPGGCADLLALGLLWERWAEDAERLF